eukprot:15485314-Alexandrium_andersonii.AAC.1
MRDAPEQVKLDSSAGVVPAVAEVAAPAAPPAPLVAPSADTVLEGHAMPAQDATGDAAICVALSTTSLSSEQ